MSGTTSDNQQWVNLLRVLDKIARFVTALLVLWFVAEPIGEAVKTQVSVNIAAFISDKPADIHPPVEAITKPAAKTKPQRTTKAGPAKKQADTMINVNPPRVWAYGIQVLGLVAALGITFWAIVALIRSD